MNIQKTRPSISGIVSCFVLAGAIGVSTLAISGASTSLLPSPVYAEPVSLKAPEISGFSSVVKAVSPAVVSVRVKTEEKRAKKRFGQGFSEFRFDRRFFDNFDFDLPFFDRDKRYGGKEKRYGERSEDRERKEHRRRRNHRFGMSQGSGFFVSGDGYIVTSEHVISRGKEFLVTLNDGMELEATLVGSDKRTDLAVLKVKSDKKFTYVDFDDKSPEIGEWVVAVGNPFGLGGTVTAGIVSANGREIASNRHEDFIQIDAAVNRGNSGGPTFNLSGRVIGVNTAIFSPSGGNVGIAFAVSASTADEIVKDLIQNGRVVRGWLGVQIQPVTRDIAESIGLKEAMGAIVAGVQDDSPAKVAGVETGDVITSVNGEKIKGPKELARKIGRISPESEVLLSLWRKDAVKEVKVKLGSLKGGEMAMNANPEKIDRSLAQMGLELRQMADGKGVEVADVDPDSRVADTGIQSGDRIISVNGEEVSMPRQILEIVQKARKLGRKAVLFQIEGASGHKRFVAVPVHQDD